MKTPAHRKISYVIKSHNDEQAHCLGVNSLAIDSTHCKMNETTANGGLLYSAGRDGVVANWDLGLQFKKEIKKNGEDTWNIDRQLQNPKEKTKCKAFSQMHTDWVNDIVLCEKGTCVVSASSDRTIKLWKPNGKHPKTAYTIGTHTDYAKCLTYASNAGWVASGGLDRKIKVWDISQSKEIISMDTGPSNLYTNGSNESNTLHHSASKCSIYALATNPAGSLVASGSPEKVIRLWDPKSGKRVGKLTGHTDNIRALLMSEDGKYVLSGSSDATIKLWSVAARRCLATYETHPDSVWSLFSNHPDLKTFYSGSRDGLVNRTEISGRAVSDSDGESVGLFKEDSGVVKIAALQDTFVWTATSSSNINRWLSVPSHKRRQTLPRSDLNPDIPSKSIVKLQPAKDSFSSPVRNSYIASDQLTVYAGSVLSIPVSYHEDEIDQQDTLIPLRSIPDYIIEGRPGIVSHLMLQNRCHILTKDTNGEVAMWDLIKCLQIKKFGKRDIEEIAQEVNGLESSPAWCSVDTKIGAITVQLHKTNCFDCELYVDEIELPKDYEAREDHRLNLGKWVLAHLFKNFIQREVAHQKNGNTRYIEENPEKMESAQNKTETPQKRPEAPEQNASSMPTLAETEEPKLPLAAVTTNTEQSPYIPTSPQETQFSGTRTATPTVSTQPDYFSGNHHAPQSHESLVQPPVPAALPMTPATPSTENIMTRIKKKFNRTLTSEDKPVVENTQPIATSSTNSVSVTPTVSTPVAKPDDKDTIQTIKEVKEDEIESYTPVDLNDFPLLNIQDSTVITIAEESAEASTGMDLYRGTVDSAGDESDTIIEAAPAWLLSYLLYNKIPIKEAVKLTFILRPTNGTRLEELPGGPNNRLLANRMLRVRKLLQYISEKMKIEDESSIELLCGDTVLLSTMTLSAIRQHVLKTGGDIPLSYRLKDEKTISN